MTDAWKDYALAPQPGAVLCAAADLPETGTLCLIHGGFPILLARRGGRLFAYVNACPHQYLPLNHKGERLLSADGAVLRCTSHGAGFLTETGEGVEGPGLGAALDPIPVAVNAAGEVVIV
ncbi:MAG: Rieske 2Fe-2S domain-containing protein [Paracoccaceae bacterium]